MDNAGVLYVCDNENYRRVAWLWIMLGSCMCMTMRTTGEWPGYG